MAVIGTGAYTTLDIVNQLEEGESVWKRPINKLRNSSPLWRDGKIVRSNKALSNTRLTVTGLPDAVLTGANQGVAPSKPILDPLTDTLCVFENSCVIDEDHPEYQFESDAQFDAWRAQMGELYQMKLIQAWNYEAIYGNRTINDKSINGLITRLNDLSLFNVHDAGGSGSELSSILVVAHHEDGFCLIEPRNTKGGLRMTDRGLERITVGTGGDGAAYHAWVEDFAFAGGIQLADPEFVHRIANVDADAVLAQSGTQAPTAYSTHVFNLITVAQGLMPEETQADDCKLVAYLPRTVYAGMLNMQNTFGRANAITSEQVAGQGTIYRIGAVELRRMDALGYGESELT